MKKCVLVLALLVSSAAHAGKVRDFFSKLRQLRRPRIESVSALGSISVQPVLGQLPVKETISDVSGKKSVVGNRCTYDDVLTFGFTVAVLGVTMLATTSSKAVRFGQSW